MMKWNKVYKFLNTVYASSKFSIKVMYLTCYNFQHNSQFFHEFFFSLNIVIKPPEIFKLKSIHTTLSSQTSLICLSCYFFAEKSWWRFFLFEVNKFIWLRTFCRCLQKDKCPQLASIKFLFNYYLTARRK